MQEQINQYTTEIALAVVSILVVLVKGWLNGLKKKAEAYYESKTTTEQRKTLAFLGKEAFSFAETAYKELKGPDKLAEAVKYLEAKAASNGLSITAEEVRAAVEAAWLEDKRKEFAPVELAEIRTFEAKDGVNFIDPAHHK
ncbi:MAG: Phage holin protein (Holin_LLH) [Pelotomaculum sp. PtaB.Bin104]|nr:MAG: Phage holin protein (Holin_LLH) [Pelotomaculum sp. PtaB.Bin104]